MNMAEDQVDETVKGESFGEVTEREAGDEGGKPVLVEDKVKTLNNQEQSEDETQSDSNEETDEGGETEEQTEEGEEPELTEKGTKLDKNPQSRIHQELANEKKVRSQMEQVLASPELLARFAKERYGIDVPVKGAEAVKADEETQTATPEVKEYKAEDFENLDDVAKVVNGLQQNFVAKTKEADQKIEKLTGMISSLVDGGKRQVVAQNITQGVDSLRKEKELDPQSPDFIDGLEEKIASRFNQLDFDEKTQSYKGQYSITEVGKELIDAIRMGRKAGSQKAQTIVKDKTAGKIKTSSNVDSEVDTGKLKPEDSIALGISKMFK